MARRVVIERPDAPETPCDHESLTAGAWCSACVAVPMQEETARKTALAFNDVQMAEYEAEQSVSSDVPFAGPIAFENQATGDGRLLATGSLRWGTLPIPLRYVAEDVGGHDGATVVGLIETLEVRDGALWATGFVDGASPDGPQVLASLSKGSAGGISIDLDDVSFEVRVKKELFDALSLEMDAETDENEPEEPETDENGYVTVHKQGPGDQLMYVTDARVRAATLCAVPAFEGAKISLVASIEGVETVLSEDQAHLSLIAAGIPVNPPAMWFANPELTEPTPLTITDDGRVYGHGALWGTCHIGIPGHCVTPPYSATNYAWFHTGAIRTAEGTDVPAGKITLDTGHADQSLRAAPAAAHYDNTGAVVADVVAYEDAHGIVLAGALRPGVTPQRLRELRAAPLSGDWREIGGNLELVGMLAVNTPGFGVPRTRALVAGGSTQTLFVASPHGTVIAEHEVSEEEAVPEIRFAKAYALAEQVAKIRRRQMLAAIQMEG